MTERGKSEGEPTPYDTFLREGISSLLEEFSPIMPITGNSLTLKLREPTLSDPREDELECIENKSTLSASLRVDAILEVKETREYKSQELYLGELPLMTKRGKFIVEGVEKTPSDDVTEIFEHKLRIGLRSMIRTAQKRMAIIDPDYATPSALISYRVVARELKRALEKATKEKVIKHS